MRMTNDTTRVSLTHVLKTATPDVPSPLYIQQNSFLTPSMMRRKLTTRQTMRRILQSSNRDRLFRKSFGVEIGGSRTSKVYGRTRSRNHS